MVFDQRWVRFPRILLFVPVFILVIIILPFGLPDAGHKDPVKNEFEGFKEKVRSELRELERLRDQAQKKYEKTKNIVLEEENKLKTYKTQLTEIKAQILARDKEPFWNIFRRFGKSSKELKQQAAIAHPSILPPVRLLPSGNVESVSHVTDLCSSFSSQSNCFDHSRCPLTRNRGFQIYIPPGSIHDSFLRENFAVTTNPEDACVWVQFTPDFDQIERTYWHGDGRNNIVIFTENEVDLQGQQLERAIYLGPNLKNARFDFDLSLPFNSFIPIEKPVWEISPDMIPIKRKTVLNFLAGKTDGVSPEVSDLIQSLKSSEAFQIEQNCRTTEEQDSTNWKLCENFQFRFEQLSKATFSLIPVEDDIAGVMPRMIESFLSGAVPIVLSYSGNVIMPLTPTIDWSQVIIQLPFGRIPELPFFLSSITPDHIFTLRRQGRFLYEEYFSREQKLYITGLSIIRNRIGLPAEPYQPVALNPHHIVQDYSPTLPAEPNFLDEETKEEFIALQSGPRIASPTYPGNYSFIYQSNFNTIGPFGTKILDFRADHFPLPSEAKFHEPKLNFDPVCNGEGGDGTEYQKALGGNYPTEQFTVVMLTYKREDVLLISLSRLVNQPNLNKVVVVWNSPYLPPSDYKWPDIGAPIEVVIPPRNSLNNRFLPLDNIETEAILSLDDDAHLRRDEIEFGFRTWREHRAQIVGFPGRFHSWYDNQWNYNSNHTCELSMVLTGAAFFHKQYTYLYSYWQPQAIRELVDEAMNCEDIALNFLVSHVTRKPPVKVTSRWTFRCAGCPEALSQTDGHFLERHECIRKLTRIWGYNPLIYTQYRADSVLFKTRLPRDKLKCYKFI